MTRSTGGIVLGVLATLLLGCSPKDDDAGGAEGGATEASLVEPAGATESTLAEAKVLNLSVQGMHCDGCATAIAGTVRNVNGVLACEASYEKGSAVVHLGDASAEAAVIEAIEGMGYTVARGG